MNMLIAVGFYWTFAVATMALFVVAADSRESNVARATLIGLAIFWPFVALVMIPVLIYQASVSSTTTLRNDLRSRKLLAEFTAWNDAKQKALILPEKPD